MLVEIEEREIGDMTLNIGGIEIEVPEELVRERMEFLDVKSEADIRADLERKANLYHKSYQGNGMPMSDFGKNFVGYLSSELDIFRS